ncbi:hypothetical protein [Coraliomargarita parva]|uniref:hypothetical protein n=1 Tax=Coraliomargarita parva TaxID=3014050 RepID=UPI0022B5B70C|nr:hypothetical protein [Coraliomargarita parva]
MRHLFTQGALCFLSLCSIKAEPIEAEDWDLVRVYETSTLVFYGKVTKTVPERDFKPGAMGVHVTAIDSRQLSLEPVIWPQAKEISIDVLEAFKGTLPLSTALFIPDPDPLVWTYVENEAGDVFLAQPEAIDSLIGKLQSGDEALFYARPFLGTQIPLIYRARFGQRALDDLAVLRAHRASGQIPIQEVRQRVQRQQEVKALRDAAAFETFEDEYYTILREQDQTIRRLLLEDLIQRMGFKGRWNYDDYRQRYLALWGHYLDDNPRIPSSPAEGREKLWHDISQELIKLDIIEKSKASNR